MDFSYLEDKALDDEIAGLELASLVARNRPFDGGEAKTGQRLAAAKAERDRRIAAKKSDPYKNSVAT